VFASSFCTTSSAELYSCYNCCVTTIVRRSSMFLDDFDAADDDAELPMIDV